MSMTVSELVNALISGCKTNPSKTEVTLVGLQTSAETAIVAVGQSNITGHMQIELDEIPFITQWNVDLP